MKNIMTAIVWAASFVILSVPLLYHFAPLLEAIKSKKMNRYIKYMTKRYRSRINGAVKNINISKEKIMSIKSGILSFSKRAFLLLFPFVVAISLWTTILISILILFSVVVEHKSAVIDFIWHDENLRIFSYFPLSYLGFLTIIWFTKDIWKYAERLYSSQIQQLYFLVSIVTALIFLSIDRVWS